MVGNYEYLLPIFVGHPFNADYTKALRDAIRQACELVNSSQPESNNRFMWQPEFLAEKGNTQLETVYTAVSSAIRESAICIFEVSGGTNVNVFFELGLALGMSRALALFSHTSFKNAPSDILGIRGIQYDDVDDLASKIEAILRTRSEELRRPPTSQEIIHQKMQIDSNWRHHLIHATQGLYYLAGDLSWADEYQELIGQACERGVTIQICCRRPKDFEERKWQNISQLRHVGAHIRLFPPHIDPRIRGFITEPEKLDSSTEVMLVEKETRTTHSQNYQRTGITIGESKYLYKANIYRGGTHIRHVTAFVSLFERLWESTLLESYH